MHKLNPLIGFLRLAASFSPSLAFAFFGGPGPLPALHVDACFRAKTAGLLVNLTLGAGSPDVLAPPRGVRLESWRPNVPFPGLPSDLDARAPSHGSGPFLAVDDTPSGSRLCCSWNVRGPEQ
jgi:hypothetical protein